MVVLIPKSGILSRKKKKKSYGNGISPFRNASKFWIESRHKIIK